MTASSAFATEAGKRFVAPNRGTCVRRCLHGAIYGVPVTGKPFVDRRPASDALSRRARPARRRPARRLRVGAAGDSGPTSRDRAAARRVHGAEDQSPGIGRRSRRARGARARRGVLVAAWRFCRHRPLSAASADRRRRRARPRPATRGPGGQPSLQVAQGYARRRATRGRWPVRRAARRPSAATWCLRSSGKPTLIQASEMHDQRHRPLAGRRRAGADRSARGQSAAPHASPSPTEPMVAIRGASRSLRHGGDGRGSADGKLTCRWPTHVIDEISGVIAKDRFIRSLGNGSIPPESADARPRSRCSTIRITTSG